MSTFPLYTYFESELAEDIKQVNFTSKFIKFLKVRKLSSKTPEQILAYIYAILYSPAYREKYYEFLKIDFPRIPFTQDIKLFDKLSEIGQYLIDLHLLKIDFETSIVSFPVENPNLKVENIKYNEGKVYINLTTYFDNVSLDVWNYYIGGYQVLYKWLKERKKHHYTLTIDDVRHFMKVCDVLNETIKIQQKIDFLTKEWI
jgi:predicted helicase